MRRTPSPRIFVGLTEIAGYYGRLARGLRAEGVRTTFIDLGRNPFAYPRGEAGLPGRIALWAARRRHAAEGRERGHVMAAKVVYRLALALLFAWALPRHDVFVFGFRTSFFWLRELPLLRRLGKGIVFVFNGSDARPAYIDGSDMDPALGRSLADCIALTRTKKREIRQVERWADLVVGHALYLHLFERPAAGFQALGLPGPLPESLPAVPPEPSAPPIRILHSPSRPAAKGTDLIRAAVERLRADGLALELVELQDVPNSVVHAELPRCHFVVDQAYSDGPMLGFSHEAALYGRPAVVGSYGWDEIRRLTPAESFAPGEGCHPDGLEAAIRRLATDGEYRRTLGAAARRFVEGWTADLVARRFLRLLRGERPPEWMCDPAAVRYVHGVGLSEQRAREIVTGVVALGGPEALQVGDKPELERAFLDFIAPRS